MISHLPNHFKGHRKPHRATGQNIATGTTQKCLSGRWLGEKGFKIWTLKYL